VIEIAPKSLAEAEGFNLALTEPDKVDLFPWPFSSKLGQWDDPLGPGAHGSLLCRHAKQWLSRVVLSTLSVVQLFRI